MEKVMKLLLKLFFALAVILSILISGCDLTNDQAPSNSAPSGSGQDLILTEVFTISPDRYYAYSWLEVYNPTNRSIRWTDVSFPVYSYAVGTGGKVLNTFDDGLSWSDTLSDPLITSTLNSVAFPNADTGFVVGNDRTVLKVYKGGRIDLSSRTFTLVPIGTNFNGVAVSPDVTNRIAFIVGDKGTVLRTVDRGVTWRAPQNPLGTQKSLRAVTVQFPRVFAVGDSGSIYKSSNSGTIWAAKIIPEPFRETNFYGVTFINDTGWAAGENGTILVSQNAGESWLPETSNVTETLRSIFINPLDQSFIPGVGWAVGDNGTLLKTTNNGVVWTSNSSGTQTRLNAITFADSARGWIYGDQGLILATTNGGLSWHAQNSGTTSDLKSGTTLPLLIQVQNQYIIQMYGQRSYVFFDPQTGTLNTDFITKIDTGIIFYGAAENVVQGPGTFVIVSNDSIKFQDHTKLGPGSTKILNFALAVDPSVLTSGIPALLKWALLPSSEIRLLKIFARSVGENQVEFEAKVVDVVRFGGYRPTPDDYPNNDPADFIPEFWSLARYNNDYGGPANQLNTKNSFFMAKDPIPGWFSQERKP